jgi:hypothetical protein
MIVLNMFKYINVSAFPSAYNASPVALSELRGIGYVKIFKLDMLSSVITLGLFCSTETSAIRTAMLPVSTKIIVEVDHIELFLLAFFIYRFLQVLLQEFNNLKKLIGRLLLKCI